MSAETTPPPAGEGSTVVSYADRYAALRRGSPASPEATAARATERAYQAFTLDPTKRRLPARLRLHYGNGTLGLMSYGYLMEVLSTDQQHLSLIYTGCVITLAGRHLHPLVDALQEEKVRSIHCFNSRQHDPPPPDQPLVEQMTRQSLGQFEKSLGG